jgi:hypothetical protein
MADYKAMNVLKRKWECQIVKLSNGNFQNIWKDCLKTECLSIKMRQKDGTV